MNIALPVAGQRVCGFQTGAFQTDPLIIHNQPQRAGKIHVYARCAQFELKTRSRQHRGIAGASLPEMFILAQRFQLTDGGLPELTVAVAQLARTGHLVDPAVRPRRLEHLFAVRHAHPADEDAAAIFCHRGLRRVKFETGVKLMQLAVPKCRRLIIKCPTHPDGRIGIEIAMRFARQPLRAADQDVCAIKLKQIRALPHIARVRESVDAVTGDFAAGRPGV